MTKEEMIQKLCSRKLWMATAAFLAELGAGLASGNDFLIGVGIVCTALSSGIYVFANAYQNGEIAKANATTTTKTVTAQATDKATVQAVMGTDKAE